MKNEIQIVIQHKTLTMIMRSYSVRRWDSAITSINSKTSDTQINPSKFLTQPIITNENHAVVVRSRYSVNRCHCKSIKKTLSTCPDRKFNKGSSKINRNDAVEDLKSVQETKVCVYHEF